MTKLNIAEAVKDMKQSGQTCIARDLDNGNRFVVKPTDSKERCIRGIFGPDRPLSYPFVHWSPGLADLSSDAWYVPDMRNQDPPAQKAAPVTETPAPAAAPEPEPAAAPPADKHDEILEKLMGAPVRGEDFKRAVERAKTMQLFDALSKLCIMRDEGKKVKGRFEVLQAEFERKKEMVRSGRNNI